MQEIKVKELIIKISAIAFALVSTLLMPVGTAGFTGSFETVPITQSALAALPIVSKNDVLILKAMQSAVEKAVISDFVVKPQDPHKH